ncbi:hypothetical protein [Methylocystis iwaonis]|uniref:hypothetical protein n=1 Tax=Methylocystis iwaonis TaxID=2885079 RepID=UPI002E7C1AA8|nr:hypothetical protein [Methylocystis iwaonis]
MTATETAMAALVAALNASSTLPDVRRDAVFDEVLEEFADSGETYGRALVLRIGDSIDVVRRLGDGPEAYEHVRNADVEWFVARRVATPADGAALAQKFDAGIEAIFAAVDANPTLSDAVTRAEIAEALAVGSDSAGSKSVLTALIHVQLTYTSARAY